MGIRLDTSADKATMQWIGSLLLYHQTQAVVVNNCFVDRKRLLPYKAARGPMSIDSCIDLCEGFDFAGVENGDECWCGNDYPAEEFQAPMAECSTVCSGDDSQLCGGRWRINIFDVPEKDPRPHEDGDCYDDRTRILSDYRGDNSDTLTIGSCIDLCEGYEYAGTQNGNECWCGNDYPSHDLKRSTASCNKPCSGDDSQLCGGSWRINIYDVPKKDPAPHTDGDCYEDNRSRVLPYRAARSESMTVDTCIQLCEKEYQYAGLAVGKECWCGNDYPSNDLKRSTSSCKTPCAGDESQFCGASWRLNIYEVPDASEQNLADLTFFQDSFDSLVDQTFAAKWTSYVTALKKPMGKIIGRIKEFYEKNNCPNVQDFTTRKERNVSPCDNIHDLVLSIQDWARVNMKDCRNKPKQPGNQRMERMVRRLDNFKIFLNHKCEYKLSKM